MYNILINEKITSVNQAVTAELFSDTYYLLGVYLILPNYHIFTS
jgi:hypothetical protein